MDASDALRLAQAHKADAEAKANAESIRRSMAIQQAINQIKFELPRYLEQINALVRHGAERGGTSCRTSFSIANQTIGHEYFKALGETLAQQLVADGFKVTYEARENLKDVYDGSMMNPEIVGYEYTDSELKLTISWEAE